MHLAKAVLYARQYSPPHRLAKVIHHNEATEKVVLLTTAGVTSLGLFACVGQAASSTATTPQAAEQHPSTYAPASATTPEPEGASISSEATQVSRQVDESQMPVEQTSKGTDLSVSAHDTRCGDLSAEQALEESIGKIPPDPYGDRFLSEGAATEGYYPCESL